MCDEVTFHPNVGFKITQHSGDQRKHEGDEHSGDSYGRSREQAAAFVAPDISKGYAT